MPLYSPIAVFLGTTALRNAGMATAVAMLAACGGGSGGGGISRNPGPAPAPAPSPAPAPTPTPPPTNFDTAETRRSDGPQFHNAITLWQAGNTGAGVAIGIIDTGIDTDNPEFAGRISAASRDVAGNSTFEAEDDHGTNVALIAAAARNGSGVVGIAYDASLVVFRADRPGSCATETDETLDGCQFFDSDIARGVDAAVAAGARVINLSLGGGNPSQRLRDAVAAAAAAGAVIVVSAGNDGDSTDADLDPDNPDPFAIGLLQAGGRNVIIVGSVDKNGMISGFSNRAGSYGTAFLAARGERVCCVYRDGELLVETENGQQFVTVISGTSFAAPQVSGAVALLAQAFPNLTGAEITELLLTSARDAGDPGVDRTYGTGILDIARAFAPQGTTAIAGTRIAVTGLETHAVASPAMGDAMVGRPIAAIVTDRFDRPYAIDLAARARSAALSPVLRNTVERRTDVLALGSAHTSMAFTVDRSRLVNPRDPVTQLRLMPEDAQAAKVLAATIATRVAPDLQVGFAFAQGVDGLVAQMQGHERPAFLISRDARSDNGFGKVTDTSVAIRRQFGATGVTLSGATGNVLSGVYPASEPGNAARAHYAMSSMGMTVDRKVGPVETALGLSWLAEERTMLGAYLSDALGANGADSLFLDVSAGWRFADDWRMGANLRQGLTRAHSGGFIEGSGRMWSSGWSLDLTKDGVLAPSDTLGFRVSQPLRVEAGGVNLNLPASFDFATETASYDIQRLNLSPGGRELVGELAWTGRLWNGYAGASLFYRNEPGHIADSPADFGVAVKFDRRF